MGPHFVPFSLIIEWCVCVCGGAAVCYDKGLNSKEEMVPHNERNELKDHRGTKASTEAGKVSSKKDEAVVRVRFT